MAAGGFMKASVPFLVFYFSAQILNHAIEGDYEACVKSVAVLLLSQFVCELVNRFCQKTDRSTRRKLPADRKAADGRQSI